jgi:hypothetical protein
LDADWKPKAVVLGGHHHGDLLWGNALGVWNGFHLGNVGILGIVFGHVKAEDFVFGGALLCEDGFFRTVNDEIPAAVHTTFARSGVLYVFVLG